MSTPNYKPPRPTSFYVWIAVGVIFGLLVGGIIAGLQS